MIYVDTSALFKLVKNEAESPALKQYLLRRKQEGSDVRLMSSALLAVEIRRGVLRNVPHALPRADVVLGDVATVGISGAVIESAGRLPDPLLRSLDAIHLATALMFREDVDVVLTYDDRLATAATSHGLPTAAPT